MSPSQKTHIEQKQVRQIALYSLLSALPLSAASTLVVVGDAPLWAGLQKVFSMEEAVAQASISSSDGCPPASITYSGGNVWKNNSDIGNLAVVAYQPCDSGDSG